MSTIWQNPNRTTQQRIDAELKSVKIPLRHRIDALWLLLAGIALMALVIIWLAAVLVGQRYGFFDPPPIQPITDSRILINVQKDLSKNPLLDGVFHVNENILYLSQKGGKIHRYNPDTRLWSTETPFIKTPQNTPLNSGNLLLNRDIVLLRAGTGRDPLSNFPENSWDTSSLWGLTATNGLVRRHQAQWEIIKSDTLFIGSHGTPIKHQQLTTAALSTPAQWLLLGTQNDGFGIYDLENKYWLRLSPTLFKNLTSTKITHAAWALNRFWLGTPNGLYTLALTHKEPQLTTISQVTGTIKDMDVDPQGQLWIMEQRHCYTGSHLCMRLIRFEPPNAIPHVLIDQMNAFPNLILDDLHFARYWSEEQRLLVAGSAGLYSYDTRLHNWSCHFRGAISQLLPFPGNQKGFYFAYTGGIGLVNPQAPPWQDPAQKCQTWSLPGMNTNERIIALHYSQSGDKNKPRYTVLALGLSGQVFALDRHKPKDQLTIIWSGSKTTNDPAKFLSVAAFGDIVLFVGEKQATIHDFVRRTYIDIPAANLPQWISSPYLQMVASGEQVYAASHKEGEAHMYRLSTSDAAAGNFKAATLLAIIPGPVSRIRDWNGQGIGVIAGPGDGRLFRFSSGKEELIGPSVDDMNGIPLLDAAPYLSGVIFATPLGLRDYDYQSRSWGRFHRLQDNDIPKELAACNDHLFFSTQDGRLLEIDLSGNYQNHIGSQEGFDMNDIELSDVRLDSYKLFLAGKGFINRYDTDVRGITERWQIPTNAPVTLVGSVINEPLSIAAGIAYIGDQPLDPYAGRVLNVSTDNDYIWSVRQKPSANNTSAQYIKRYAIINPMATSSRSYFYNPYSGSGTAPITDAVRLPDEIIAVATQVGLRFYSPVARSWFQRVNGDPIPRGGRLYLLGRHLILAGETTNGTQLTVINLDAQPWPSTATDNPVIIQPQPRPVRTYTIDPTQQQLAYITTNGAVHQWHGPLEIETLPPTGDEPAPNTLKRVFSHPLGNSNCLTFSTDTGFTRYNLDRHYWSPISLNLPTPGLIADSNCEITPIQQWFTIKTTQGSFYIGTLDLSPPNPAKPSSIDMRLVFSPTQKFGNSGDEIIDVQQRDSQWWTFVLKDRIKYFNSIQRQWLPDVLLSDVEGEPQFYQWQDRAVVVSQNRRVWWVGRQKGLYPNSFARYTLKVNEQMALDSSGTIWRLSPEGNLYRLLLPASGDYRDPVAPFPRTITALEIDSSGRLYARYDGGMNLLSSLATNRFDRLPPALNVVWLKWNRDQKTFSLQTTKGVMTITREQFVHEGRLPFETIDALLVKSSQQIYAANSQGIFTYTSPDCRLNDSGIIFRQMNWRVPSSTAHGCFIASDTSYRIEPDGSPTPIPSSPYIITFGDVSIRENSIRHELSGRLKNGKPIFAARGFLWDQNRRGLAYTANGLLVLSDAGLHPIQQYTAFENIPGGVADLFSQRLYSPGSGVIYFQRGSSWWQRTAPGQWKTISSDPINNRILIDNATWKWQLVNQQLRIQLKNNSFHFQPIFTSAGLAFNCDLVRDAVSFNSRLAVISEAFIEITDPGDGNQLSLLKAPRFSLPHPSVEGLRVKIDEQNIQDLLAYAGTQYYRWDEGNHLFTPMNRSQWQQNAGLRITFPATNPRLRFTRSISASGISQILKEFRVDLLNGSSRWVPFSFYKQRFPFDIVTSIAVFNNQLYVGTPAGLQVYSGSFDTTLAANGLFYALQSPGGAFVPVDTVGIPAERRHVLVVEASGNTWEKTSSDTFKPISNATPLTRRWRFGQAGSFWQFFNINGKLEAYYTDETGKLAPPAIRITNGRFPHDQLLDVVIHQGQVFTLSTNSWLSRFVDGSTVLRQSGQVINYNTAAYQLQRFIPVLHDINVGVTLVPAGLYVQGKGNRLWRYTDSSLNPWQEQTNPQIISAVVQQADQPYIVNRKNLRLLAPYKEQTIKGQPVFVFQYRTQANEWMNIPWEGDRIAIDNWTQFIEADQRLWAATSLGLVLFSRAPKLLGKTPSIILDPDQVVILPIPRENTTVPVVTDISALGKRITFRCDSKSERVYSGIPALNTSTPCFTSSGKDPFIYRVDVSQQSTGFWEWVVEGCVDYNPGVLKGKLKGEVIDLVGGRFSFDTINSIAFYQNQRVEIATDAGGWYYGAGLHSDVANLCRPRVPGVNNLQVKEVLSSVNSERQPLLGLRIENREYIRLDKNQIIGKTLQFSQYLGSDFFWHYSHDNQTQQLVIIASRSSRSNGSVERQMFNGRFSDDIVLGLPISASDKEGNYYLVPTQAGVLRMNAALKVTDIYTDDISPTAPEQSPRILYVDLTQKLVQPYYLLKDQLKPLVTTSISAVPRNQNFTLNVPLNARLLAIENGPQDFMRLVWEKDKTRGWTLVKQTQFSSIEQFNCLYVNLSSFDKYLSHRNQFGSIPPWMRVKVNREDVEFLLYRSVNPYRLRLPDATEVISAIVKDKKLLIIGKNHLWEIDLEQAMMKAKKR